MKASVARTIKAILGKLLRFFGLRHIGRERAALNHEPRALTWRRQSLARMEVSSETSSPGRHQARGTAACGSSSAEAAGEDLRGRRRRKRGSLRGKDRCRSLADLPTGRPGDTHNGLPLAAVPPSGGWRHTGPLVAGPAFARPPIGGEFETSDGHPACDGGRVGPPCIHLEAENQEEEQKPRRGIPTGARVNQEPPASVDHCNVAPPTGLEPVTDGLTVRCSTN